MTPARNEDGFSLIETMAALAVVAIAGLALVNMTQATTRNTAAVQERSLAMLAAENLMNTELLRAGGPEDRDGVYRMGGLDYEWRLEVSATDAADLVRLHLTVGQGDAVYAELDTFTRPDP